MDRKIYLINETDNIMPSEGRMFVGTQDPDISTTGMLRSHLLSYYLKEINAENIFSSPMKRCTAIAETSFVNYYTSDQLKDSYLGPWQDYDIDLIKLKFNKLYIDWIEDPDMVPPEGEKLNERSKRLEVFINNTLETTTGNIVIITHSNVIRPYLCDLQGIKYNQMNTVSIPFCSISIINYDGNGFTVEESGTQSFPELTDEVCISIDRLCGLGEDDILNCIEVSKLAVEIAEKLSETGLLPDIDSIRSAALLKNICGKTKDDATDAGMIIEVLGYPVQSYAVKNHLNLHFTNIVNEGTILYIANRLVSGDKRLTLAELFENDYEEYSATGKSLEEMKNIHEEDGFIVGMINRLCDKMVIK